MNRVVPKMTPTPLTVVCPRACPAGQTRRHGPVPTPRLLFGSVTETALSVPALRTAAPAAVRVDATDKHTVG